MRQRKQIYLRIRLPIIVLYLTLALHRWIDITEELFLPASHNTVFKTEVPGRLRDTLIHMRDEPNGLHFDVVNTGAERAHRQYHHQSARR